MVEILLDRSDERGHVLEAAATNPFVGQLAKLAFGHVEPGTRRRNEMQMESRMAVEPAFHPRMFVRPVVVDDQMQIELGRGDAIDRLQEPEKLLMPMTGHTIPDHFAVEHAEGRKQGGRAVALVVVRPRPAAARLHRQARLSAVEGLDLTLLVHTQHQGLVRRIQIQPDDIRELLDEVLVAAEFEALLATRLAASLWPDA